MSQGLSLLPQGFLEPQKAFSSPKNICYRLSTAAVSLSRSHTPCCAPGASPALPSLCPSCAIQLCLRSPEGWGHPEGTGQGCRQDPLSRTV